MSDTPATPAVVSPSPTPVAGIPAPKLNAIQIIEQELFNFFKQREQAVANVHAVDGAIQGAQKLLGILKAEAAKAEVEAKKLLADAQTEVTEVEGEVKAEVVKVEEKAVTEIGKVVEFVKKEL